MVQFYEVTPPETILKRYSIYKKFLCIMTFSHYLADSATIFNPNLEPPNFFFDVVLFLLSRLVTGPSFMSISSMFLEL